MRQKAVSRPLQNDDPSQMLATSATIPNPVDEPRIWSSRPARVERAVAGKTVDRSFST